MPTKAQPVAEPLKVILKREPFLEWFIIEVPSQNVSDECDPEETRNWFKMRGANMDVVEKALDYCWNFYRSEVTIKNPKAPPIRPAEPII